MKTRWLGAASAACLPVLLSAAGALVPSSSAASTATPVDAVDFLSGDGGVAPTWWQTASGWIARSEYHVSRTREGLQAPNRAHDLRTHFHGQGIEVTPRESSTPRSWRWAWRTTSWGRLDRMLALDEDPCTPSAGGARVTYVRPGFDEWYENKAEGLEQGFTVHTPPRGDAELRIEGRIERGLRARLLEDGAIELLDGGGVPVLHYGAPQAWDASGRALPSRLVVNENDRIAILVDDHRASYPITIDPLITSAAWTAESDQASAGFGYSVATAGDVNGDGYSDVIVGAHTYDNGQADEGRAFLYCGSASGLGANPVWTAESNLPNAAFGFSVSAAGDVNNDGFDDVIVGAFALTNGQASEGRAYVYLGSAAGLDSVPAWTAESNTPNAFFGCSVGTAGDVNHDGFADVIVGAYGYTNGQSNEGRALVYHGSAAGLDTVPDWTTEGNQVSASLGFSVGTAGDVNGDGFADVVVGSPTYSAGQSQEGRALVFHGSATGLATFPAWTVESDSPGAFFGRSAGAAGDVNGDGFTDVIVGASSYSSGAGEALVYYGSAAGLSTSGWTIAVGQSGALLGSAVGTAGDVNDDGFDDVIIGAPRHDNGQVNEGRAFVFLGSAAGVVGVEHWTVEADQDSANFGGAVGTAGDVNGDGFSDVVVGAYLYNHGQPDEGGAFAFHGSPAGLVARYTWSVASGSWSVAANWAPPRTSPAAEDVLIFDGDTTPSAIVTDVPTQAIGQLHVRDGAHVTLTGPSGSAVTLTLGGLAGPDLVIGSGSRVELASGGALGSIQLTLPSGTTGICAGELAVSGAAHQVFPTDSASLVFESGSNCVTLPGFTGNVFGNSGATNVVVFRSGSTYTYRAGGHPFGFTTTSSRIVLEHGNLFRFLAPMTGGNSYQGRTYADVEFNLTPPITLVGTSTLSQPITSFDNITMVSGGFSIRDQSWPWHVRGNISILPAGKLEFDPPSGNNTPLRLIGTGPQTISVQGSGLGLRRFSTLDVQNEAGLTLGSDVYTDGRVWVIYGHIRTGPHLLHMGRLGLLLADFDHWVIGNLGGVMPETTSTFTNTFYVGDEQRAAPFTVSIPSISDSGTIIVRTDPGDHVDLASSGLDPARSVNRSWTVENRGVAFTTCDVTFQFDSTDVDAGADPSLFRVGQRDGITWSLPAFGLRTATSTQATGLSGFGEFAVAEEIGPAAVDPIASLKTSLAPARPSPFRTSTTLEFTLERAAAVELSIHGVNGGRIRMLERGVRGPGSHRIDWDGRDDGGRRVPPGVYFSRLVSADQSFRRRLVRIE